MTPTFTLLPSSPAVLWYMLLQVHRETTGPELWTQTSGKIDALVAGVGTGGTLTGSGQYLKVMKPSIQVCSAQETWLA